MVKLLRLSILALCFWVGVRSLIGHAQVLERARHPSSGISKKCFQKALKKNLEENQDEFSLPKQRLTPAVQAQIFASLVQADNGYSFFKGLELVGHLGYEELFLPALAQTSFAVQSRMGLPELQQLMVRVRRAQAPSEISAESIKQAADKIWPMFKYKRIGRTAYDHEIPVVSVKDQCDWGSCWVQAPTAQKEIELAAQLGVQTKLSADYIFMHHLMREYGRAFDIFIVENIDVNFAESLIVEGQALYMYRQYLDQFGIIPESAWRPGFNGRGDLNAKEVKQVMKALVQSYKKRYLEATDDSVRDQVRSDYFNKMVRTIYDIYGRPPENFKFKGKVYTPKSFAETFFPSKDREILHLKTNRELDISTLPETKKHKEALYSLADNIWIEATQTRLVKEASYEEINHFLLENLNQNRPVLISVKYVNNNDQFYVNEFMGTMTSPEFPAENFSLNSVGNENHAMLIIGYKVDIQGQITSVKVLNSYGETNGNNGFYDMDMNYFRNFVTSLHVL